MMRLLMLATACTLPLAQDPVGPLVEPYPLLHGDNPTGGKAVPTSPDPLVRVRWDAAVNITALQRYETAVPCAWVADPPSAFSALDTLKTASPKVVVSAPGSLRLDWCGEHPAWFEFTSPDLSAQPPGSTVLMSISEYNEPWYQKTQHPKAYTDGKYRLETNSELYEGVRFSWIFFDAQPTGSEGKAIEVATPWHITGVKLVSQVKPVNYTGSFNSSDEVLTGSWYTGAYGSKVNMMPYGFNSILMDRGDRMSIQGDGHPTMAAALVAFGSPDTYNLVHKMLVATDSGCANHSACNILDSTIMPYPLYWTMSINDWYWASGDTARFLTLVPDMKRVIDHVVDTFLSKTLPVVWFGWDDRVSNGFCGHCNVEANLGFAALVIRATGDFAAVLKHAGQAALASNYTKTAARLAKQLRGRPSTTGRGSEWYDDYGVHAASYLINAKIVATPAEEEAMFKKVLNNSVTICSWSPFNQYWILQALGNLGNKMEYASASIRLCWGPMLTLGKGCFWELFSPEWTRFMENGDKAPTRPSYCHPWADGVTHWLTESLAGVVALTPGFRTFAALPYVSGSMPTVSAERPTPHGVISVSAKRDNAQGAVTVKVTTPVEGVIGLRLVDERTGCELDLTTVTLRSNGAVPSAATVAPLKSVKIDSLHPNVAKAHAFVRVGAGYHVVSASFKAECVITLGLADVEDQQHAVVVAAAEVVATTKSLPSVPPFPPAVYPASWVMDTETGSDWSAKYGTAGYVLPAFDRGNASDPKGGAVDLTKLPSWVNSVTMFTPGQAIVKTNAFVGADPTNSSYLVDPRNKTNRALGFITYGQDGSQGTVVDINVTSSEPFKVTLYMVSNIKPTTSRTWSFSSQTFVWKTGQAIRVMDLTTLDPIAPDPYVANCAPKGCYWTLTCTPAGTGTGNTGVRLRVTPINSDAGWSGMFFDR